MGATFPVFLIAWAIAVLVMKWKQQRKSEESEAEIERLHQRIEVLKRELEQKQDPTKGLKGLRLVSGDGDETTN
jgi:type II secretory pathway component PulJ